MLSTALARNLQLSLKQIMCDHFVTANGHLEAGLYLRNMGFCGANATGSRQQLKKITNKNSGINKK